MYNSLLQNDNFSSLQVAYRYSAAGKSPPFVWRYRYHLMGFFKPVDHSLNIVEFEAAITHRQPVIITQQPQRFADCHSRYTKQLSEVFLAAMDRMAMRAGSILN